MKNNVQTASPRAQDLRWDPPVDVEKLEDSVFFGLVAGQPRRGVIARARFNGETLYLIDRREST